MAKLVPVILSGGMGVRLWPLSRQSRPKQFLTLHGDESLIVATARRVGDTRHFHPPVFVCNEEHRFTVAEQIREAGLEGIILLEPEARNTAAAIAAAAAYVARFYPGATMLVLPSDHLIADTETFHAAIAMAAGVAGDGWIATLGIKPTCPETGYGYIEVGAAIATVSGAFEIKRFAEKPDVETASAYLETGRFVWNAGMFIMSADAALAALDAASPGMAAAAAAAVGDGQQDMDFVRLAAAPYACMPVQSFDRLVMETYRRAAVVPADMGWNDIGSWDAIWQVLPRDDDGNAVVGDTMLTDTHDCLVYAAHGMAAVIGARNLAVVVTEDSVLVLDRGQSQRVSEVVRTLQDADRPESTWSKTVHRPWGFYQDIDQGNEFRVKRIAVKPGGQLSLQQHRHRAEHWVVVAGTASVTKGAQAIELQANQSIYIPAGEKHRLENRTERLLELIEVQTGTYLGEDDIVRFEDVYGRDVGTDGLIEVK